MTDSPELRPNIGIPNNDTKHSIPANEPLVVELGKAYRPFEGLTTLPSISDQLPMLIGDETSNDNDPLLIHNRDITLLGLSGTLSIYVDRPAMEYNVVPSPEKTPVFIWPEFTDINKDEEIPSIFMVVKSPDNSYAIYLKDGSFTDINDAQSIQFDTDPHTYQPSSIRGIEITFLDLEGFEALLFDTEPPLMDSQVETPESPYQLLIADILKRFAETKLGDNDEYYGNRYPIHRAVRDVVKERDVLEILEIIEQHTMPSESSDPPNKGENWGSFLTRVICDTLKEHIEIDYPQAEVIDARRFRIDMGEY